MKSSDGLVTHHVKKAMLGEQYRGHLTLARKLSAANIHTQWGEVLVEEFSEGYFRFHLVKERGAIYVETFAPEKVKNFPGIGTPGKTYHKDVVVGDLREYMELALAEVVNMIEIPEAARYALMRSWNYLMFLLDQ